LACKSPGEEVSLAKELDIVIDEYGMKVIDGGCTTKTPANEDEEMELRWIK
jgi:hypothetical protein